MTMPTSRILSPGPKMIRTVASAPNTRNNQCASSHTKTRSLTIHGRSYVPHAIILPPPAPDRPASCPSVPASFPAVGDFGPRASPSRRPSFDVVAQGIRPRLVPRSSACLPENALDDTHVHIELLGEIGVPHADHEP